MKKRPLTEWRPVPGFEGLYEVSKCGRVKSLGGLRSHGGYRPRRLRERILKPKGQRPAVSLWTADGVEVGFRLHKLVALVWVPNPEDLPLVRHWDDNPKHNHADNLCWGTHQDNADDRVRNGLAARRLTIGQARAIKEALSLLPTAGSRYGLLPPIAKRFGVTTTMLINIRSGKAWRHA